MAAPNIVAVSTIRGKSNVANLTTTSSSIVVNPVNSGQVFKINTIMISNIDGTNAGNVSVEIKDMEGRVVSNDNVGSMSVGTYNYNLNTAKLSNGLYFVTLVSGEQRIIQKLSVAH